MPNCKGCRKHIPHNGACDECIAALETERRRQEALNLCLWDSWGAAKHYDPQKAQNCAEGYKQLQEWVQGGCKGNVLIHGNSGTGKTFAARLLAEQVHKKRLWPIGFMGCSKFHRIAYDDYAQLKRFMFCRLVVLDDISDLQVYEHSVLMFKDFIDDMLGVRLVITSNFPSSELRKRLVSRGAPEHTADAILSRLGNAEVIEFTGSDLRLTD